MSSAVVIRMTFLLPFVTYRWRLSLRCRTRSASRWQARIAFSRFWINRRRGARRTTRPIRRLPGAIVLRDVVYEVERNRILDGVSLAIRAAPLWSLRTFGGREKHAVESCGGFIHCTGGVIQVDGTDIRRFRAAGWRRQMGIVPQDCVLLNASVSENIRYARPDATDGEVFRRPNSRRESGRTLCCCGWAGHGGGNRGEMLSGGERQRLTIARALVNDPPSYCWTSHFHARPRE